MYQFFLPSPALQPFIQNYWRLRSPSFTLEERIFVDSHSDILFNFGCAYERRYLLIDTVDVMPVSNVDAQRTYPLAIVQQGDINLIAVRFKPGGLAAFVPMPVHEISNLALDLYTVFGQSAVDLENQLYDAGNDADQQVALLNSFFLQRLNLAHAHTLTRHLAERIEQTQGSIAIAELSADAGYSIRSVDRLFQQFFGMSPKFYARIVRFRHAMSLLSKDLHTSLTDIALQCGYYDLAHFSKEFSAFAGQSAEAYRAFMIAKTQAPPPNLVQFLQVEKD